MSDDIRNPCDDEEVPPAPPQQDDDPDDAEPEPSAPPTGDYTIQRNVFIKKTDIEETISSSNREIILIDEGLFYPEDEELFRAQNFGPQLNYGLNGGGAPMSKQLRTANELLHFNVIDPSPPEEGAEVPNLSIEGIDTFRYLTSTYWTYDKKNKEEKFYIPDPNQPTEHGPNVRYFPGTIKFEEDLGGYDAILQTDPSFEGVAYTPSRKLNPSYVGFVGTRDNPGSRTVAQKEFLNFFDNSTLMWHNTFYINFDTQKVKELTNNYKDMPYAPGAISSGVSRMWSPAEKQRLHRSFMYRIFGSYDGRNDPDPELSNQLYSIPGMRLDYTYQDNCFAAPLPFYKSELDHMQIPQFTSVDISLTVNSYEEFDEKQDLRKPTLYETYYNLKKVNDIPTPEEEICSLRGEVQKFTCNNVLELEEINDSLKDTFSKYIEININTQQFSPIANFLQEFQMDKYVLEFVSPRYRSSKRRIAEIIDESRFGQGGLIHPPDATLDTATRSGMRPEDLNIIGYRFGNEGFQRRTTTEEWPFLIGSTLFQQDEFYNEIDLDTYPLGFQGIDFERYRNPTNDDALEMSELTRGLRINDLIKSRICSNKINTYIAPNKIRNMENILKGEKAYSEVIGYKICKHRVVDGVVEETPIQYFYFMDNDDIRTINFVDTQITSEQTYVYRIYTLNFVVSSLYQYDSMGRVLDGRKVRCMDKRAGENPLGYEQFDNISQEVLGQQFLSCDNYGWSYGSEPHMQKSFYWLDTHMHSNNRINLHDGSGDRLYIDGSERVDYENAARGEAQASERVITDEDGGRRFEIGRIEYGGAVVRNTGRVKIVPGNQLGGGPDSVEGLLVRASVGFLYKIIQAPFFEKQVKVVDKPPLAPQVSFQPLQGIEDRIQMVLQSNFGSIRAMPVSIFDEDDEVISKMRTSQDLTADQKLEYKSDSLPKQFQIMRLCQGEHRENWTHPKNYQEFKDFMPEFGEYYKTINVEGRSFLYEETDFQPNKNYYYIFRTVDARGISNPSEIFRVRLISYENGIYLDMEEFVINNEPKQNMISFERFIQIKPANLQKTFKFGETMDPSSREFHESINNHPDGVDLGNSEESVWGKIYKMRVTSKSTGKQVDVRFKVVKGAPVFMRPIETEEEEGCPNILAATEQVAPGTPGVPSGNNTGY